MNLEEQKEALMWFREKKMLNEFGLSYLVALVDGELQDHKEELKQSTKEKGLHKGKVIEQKEGESDEVFAERAFAEYKNTP